MKEDSRIWGRWGEQQTSRQQVLKLPASQGKSSLANKLNNLLGERDIKDWKKKKKKNIRSLCPSIFLFFLMYWSVIVHQADASVHGVTYIQVSSQSPCHRVYFYFIYFFLIKLPRMAGERAVQFNETLQHMYHFFLSFCSPFWRGKMINYILW